MGKSSRAIPILHPRIGRRRQIRQSVAGLQEPGGRGVEARRQVHNRQHGLLERAEHATHRVRGFFHPLVFSFLPPSAGPANKVKH